MPPYQQPFDRFTGTQAIRLLTQYLPRHVQSQKPLDRALIPPPGFFDHPDGRSEGQAYVSDCFDLHRLWILLRQARYAGQTKLKDASDCSVLAESAKVISAPL